MALEIEVRDFFVLLKDIMPEYKVNSGYDFESDTFKIKISTYRDGRKYGVILTLTDEFLAENLKFIPEGGMYHNLPLKSKDEKWMEEPLSEEILEEVQEVIENDHGFDWE